MIMFGSLRWEGALPLDVKLNWPLAILELEGLVVLPRLLPCNPAPQISTALPLGLSNGVSRAISCVCVCV